MTTAKSRVLIILCLLFSLLLCACQTDTAGLLTLDALNNHSESEPSDAAEQDCVILPTSASEPLIARARAMTNALSRQTGVPASMFFDDEALPTSNNVRLILLGNTSHELSQKHLRKLRRDD